MVKIYLIRRDKKRPFKTLSSNYITREEIMKIAEENNMQLFKVKQGGKEIPPYRLKNNRNIQIIEASIIRE